MAIGTTSQDMTSIPYPLQPKAAEKVAALHAKIPEKWRLLDIPSSTVQRNVTGPFIESFLDSPEVAITGLPAVELVDQMTSGKLTAVEVMSAFCHRAAVAHQLVNCLIEIMFDEALATAAEIDKAFQSSKKPEGMLHGLPVSLKDQFHVKDFDTSMGYVAWIGTPDWSDPSTKESEMVREIRSQGGIPFCKTNIPTTLMCVETVNNIMGYSYNAYNRLLSTGGSSGGEGALLSLRGSPMGVGSDIGGSVRIPSSFNNLYGLRPSHGRFSYMNVQNSNPGQPHVNSVFGPMSLELSTIKLFTQAILASKPWENDPNVIEMPWREDHYIEASKHPSDICIAILDHDSTAQPHPPIKRALGIVRAALKKIGISVVEWNPPSHAEGTSIMGRIFSQDGGEEVHKILAEGNEPILPHLKAFFGEKPSPPINATEVAELTLARQHYREKYVEYWNSTKNLTKTGRPVDAVVLPVAPHAAVIPGDSRHISYSVIVNILDNSALAIPVTFADKAIDVPFKDFKPLSEFDQSIQERYDPEIYHGAPAGVQIMGRRLCEERLIALGEILQKALQRDA